MSKPAVDVEDRSGSDICTQFPPETLAGLMADVLDAEGAVEGSSAGLHIVGIPEMAELNETHMGKAGPTDVLSFPVDGVSEPADTESLIGDVLVCADVAAAQAEGHAGSVLDECRLLVVHGSLHLCGWDHADPAGQARMWDRERDLMAALGVSPRGDPWSTT